MKKIFLIIFYTLLYISLVFLSSVVALLEGIFHSYKEFFIVTGVIGIIMSPIYILGFIKTNKKK